MNWNLKGLVEGEAIASRDLTIHEAIKMEVHRRCLQPANRRFFSLSADREGNAQNL